MRCTSLRSAWKRTSASSRLAALRVAVSSPSGGASVLAVAELGAEAPHAIYMYDIAVCKPLSKLFAEELEYAFNLGA